MKTIHKYPIQITDHQTISLPMGAKPLHVARDPNGLPSLWAVVETDNPKEDKDIYVVGTGNPMPESAKTHLGTFVINIHVWHVFIGDERPFRTKAADVEAGA